MQDQPKQAWKALVKTATPGVYKRGGRYVAVYRDDQGRQRKESARTLAEARQIKAQRTREVAEGEFDHRTQVTLHDWARTWIDTYQGRGRRGFRETTRADYRATMEKYALRYFPERRKLRELRPHHVAEFIAWLTNEDAQGKRLSDKSVHNIVVPLRACLATARDQGLIRDNPARDIAMPHRPTVERDGDEVKALTAEQLAVFLAVVHPEHRDLCCLLAATGLRVSEALALDWRHLHLDGAQPFVRVRQAWIRKTITPPKTRHGRRDVPLPLDLADGLRSARTRRGTQDDEPVFRSRAGGRLDADNVRSRVVKPALEEAGFEGRMGFHVLRHTCASMLFARGANVKVVQRWLGHHSAAFTLSVYVHLLGEDLGEPLALPTLEPEPGLDGGADDALEDRAPAALFP